MNIQMNDRRKLILIAAASFACGFVACGLFWKGLPLADRHTFHEVTVHYTVDDGLGGVSTFSDLEAEAAILGSDYLIIAHVDGQVEVIPIERVVRFSCQPTGPR